MPKETLPPLSEEQVQELMNRPLHDLELKPSEFPDLVLEIRVAHLAHIAWVGSHPNTLYPNLIDSAKEQHTILTAELERRNLPAHTNNSITKRAEAVERRIYGKVVGISTNPISSPPASKRKKSVKQLP